MLPKFSTRSSEIDSRPGGYEGRKDKTMWKYEVAFINENGCYSWKGFRYADKFEGFLKKLRKLGLKILNISDWDPEGIGAELKSEYIGKEVQA